TVRVEDGRGGSDTQSFTIDVSAGVGSIGGTVFNDPNDDGLRDVLADSSQDFSGQQGQNGWFYGYYDRQNDSDKGYQASEFQALPQYVPAGRLLPTDAWFLEPFVYWTLLTSDGGVPNGGAVTSGGRKLAEHWAVRRWVSTVSGKVNISG